MPIFTPSGWEQPITGLEVYDHKLQTHKIKAVTKTNNCCKVTFNDAFSIILPKEQKINVSLPYLSKDWFTTSIENILYSIKYFKRYKVNLIDPLNLEADTEILIKTMVSDCFALKGEGFAYFTLDISKRDEVIDLIRRMGGTAEILTGRFKYHKLKLMFSQTPYVDFHRLNHLRKKHKKPTIPDRRIELVEASLEESLHIEVEEGRTIILDGYTVI